MHFKTSLIFLFFIFLLGGCTPVSEELKTAEKLLNTSPDSALHVLQNLPPIKYKSESNRALYGLLLFEAFEKTDKKMQPDSLIDYSISYYLGKNDKLHLARCYFYKGHKLLHAQHYDEANILYLKALSCLTKKNDDYLFGDIYFDMGCIKACEMNLIESQKNYRLSLFYFKHCGKKFEVNNVMLFIGNSYRNLKNYKTAQKYYSYVIRHTKDSNLIGLAYQEIGTNFHLTKPFDSAQFYLQKSLLFPYRGVNYAIRCYSLADLLFDKEQYDSAYFYATKSLKYPAVFSTQRECYRILVNVEYLRKDIKEMAKYMTLYQNYSDSARIVESQTKSAVLEKLHATTQEATGAKRNMSLIVIVFLIVLALSCCLVYFLNKRNKLKKDQLLFFKQKLNHKQEYVSSVLLQKIKETKALQANARKNALPDERKLLDLELYNNSIHYNDWHAFNREMNHAFNNIVIELNKNYPTITEKEIVWSCLHLLDVPNTDKMFLLDATSGSLYKLKQRLALKLNLKSARDLDAFLKDMAAMKE
jgi:tetratricopeptide (TPR) repeat protein